MIYIQPLRSDRINAQMQELDIQGALDLAEIPPMQHERSRSEFLRRVIVSSTGKVEDPALWTVQERIWAVAHYLSALDPGSADFEVQGGGKLLDYLHVSDPAPVESVDLAEFGADGWILRQMVGAESELAESTCMSRSDWVFADMAIRLVRAGDGDRPYPVKEPGVYASWLAERTAVLRRFASSDFEELFLAYRAGLDRLAHMWRLEFDRTGHVCMAKGGGDKGADGRTLTPVRFRVSACLSVIAEVLG